jgi:hypothetical protein
MVKFRIHHSKVKLLTSVELLIAVVTFGDASSHNLSLDVDHVGNYIRCNTCCCQQDRSVRFQEAPVALICKEN